MDITYTYVPTYGSQRSKSSSCYVMWHKRHKSHVAFGVGYPTC